MRLSWPFQRHEQARDYEAETRDRLAREVEAAERRAAHARVVADSYPRSESMVDRLLADAEKHESTAAQLQWNLDNVGVPVAEWSPAPCRDSSGGWVR
jgi:hypothetical protein